eukprot:scaffold232721_cov31-Tisochrysis_lutea.AAC.2
MVHPYCRLGTPTLLHSYQSRGYFRLPVRCLARLDGGAAAAGRGGASGPSGGGVRCRRGGALAAFALDRTC